jgi:hypothetical protein
MDRGRPAQYGLPGLIRRVAGHFGTIFARKRLSLAFHRHRKSQAAATAKRVFRCSRSKGDCGLAIGGEVI